MSSISLSNNRIDNFTTEPIVYRAPSAFQQLNISQVKKLLPTLNINTSNNAFNNNKVLTINKKTIKYIGKSLATSGNQSEDLLSKKQINPYTSTQLFFSYNDAIKFVESNYVLVNNNQQENIKFNYNGSCIALLTNYLNSCYTTISAIINNNECKLFGNSKSNLYNNSYNNSSNNLYNSPAELAINTFSSETGIIIPDYDKFKTYLENNAMVILKPHINDGLDDITFFVTFIIVCKNLFVRKMLKSYDNRFKSFNRLPFDLQKINQSYINIYDYKYIVPELYENKLVPFLCVYDKNKNIIRKNITNIKFNDKYIELYKYIFENIEIIKKYYESTTIYDNILKFESKCDKSIYEYKFLNDF